VPICDEPVSDEPISDELVSDKPESDEPISDEQVSEVVASMRNHGQIYIAYMIQIHIDRSEQKEEKLKNAAIKMYCHL